MKYLSVAIILMLSVFSRSLSQVDSNFTKIPELSFSVGPAIPYLPYPFKEFWKTGFDIGAGFGYTVASGSIGFGTLCGNIEYDHFPFDREGLMRELNIHSNIPIEGGAAVAVTVMATAKGTFASTRNVIAPYFIFGLGYMNVTSGEITFNGVTVRPKDTKSGIAYQLGGGVDVPASERIRIFVEAKFLMGFTSDPGRQYFPITLGARITP